MYPDSATEEPVDELMSREQRLLIKSFAQGNIIEHRFVAFTEYVRILAVFLRSPVCPQMV